MREGASRGDTSRGAPVEGHPEIRRQERSAGIEGTIGEAMEDGHQWPVEGCHLVDNAVKRETSKHRVRVKDAKDEVSGIKVCRGK